MKRIEEGKQYRIFRGSNPKKATHLSAKNGVVAFFWSNSGVGYYKSRRSHWHHWPIPLLAEFFHFPFFRRDPSGSGWDYEEGPIFGVD